jgi:hypothetical protein
LPKSSARTLTILPKLKSPAAIEKLSTRGKELALEYGYKPEADRLTIAPLTDPRPEAKPPNSALIFKNFEQSARRNRVLAWMGCLPVPRPRAARVFTKGQSKEIMMAEKFRYTLAKPARLLFSSITEKSAPRNVPGAKPKFSGTFGIEKEDFDAIVTLEVQAIKSEMGSFTGNPNDYYLACTSGETAAKRTLAKAALDVVGKGADEALKINEKAESRAALFGSMPACSLRLRNSTWSLPSSKPGRSSISARRNTPAPLPARNCSIPAPTSCRRWHSRASAASRSTPKTA